MVGSAPDMAGLKNMIIQKTGGNPLFIEETVQALFDEGGLVRNGSVRLVRPLEDLKIPATVQAVLASRIDRLPPTEKELLQTLAVIGREFPLGLITKVVERPAGDLDWMLGDLQSSEFIYEQPSFPDPEYTFKHALTQEVAYNSVLTELAGPCMSASARRWSRFMRTGSPITWAKLRITTAAARMLPRRWSI